MITHYFDLKAIPQEDMIQSTVVAYIMQVLHRYLPHYNNVGNEPIALAFPAYGQNRTLGGIVRLFGSEVNLLKIRDELTDLSGYALLTDCKKVPSDIKGYVSFFRVHQKGNSHISSLRERAKQRNKPWSKEHEQAVIEKYRNQKHLPYVVLKSASTNQKRMILSIDREPANSLVTAPLSGYGLNAKSQEVKASIPVF